MWAAQGRLEATETVANICNDALWYRSLLQSFGSLFIPQAQSKNGLVARSAVITGGSTAAVDSERYVFVLVRTQEDCICVHQMLSGALIVVALLAS